MSRALSLAGFQLTLIGRFWVTTEGFNGSINLILETQGESGSLLLAGGSVDAKNTYVFQVLPRGVRESEGKNLSYWSTENGNDTMMSIWNPADEAQDFAFTLLFRTGSYRIPLHLDARATRTLTISELLQNRLPDADGNTIPPDVHEGSAKLTGSHADNESILVAIDSGIFNIRKATCTYSCISCDGTVSVYVALNPFSVGKSNQTTINFMGRQNTGAVYYLGGSWTSSATGIATIGTSTGVVTGVNPGAVNMTAFLQSTAIYNSHFCGYNVFCPATGSQQGSGSGSVTPVITSISPPEGLIGNDISVSISGRGFGSSPTVLAPTGITATIQSHSDTQISATLTPATTNSGGNQAIQVKNTSAGTTSTGQDFYVQKPVTLIRSPDFGTNGLGPVLNITNGSIIDIDSNTLNTHQCGVYENIGYQLVDQNSPAHNIYGNYSLVEHFTNYSTTTNQKVPPDVTNPIVISQLILGDTQAFTKTAPACPGPNDHEQFDQSLSVKIGSTVYPLTMVNTIKRGFYTGSSNGNVTVTIKVP